MLSVLQVVASLRSDHGGTSRSVPQLCDALVARGVDVHLVTSTSPADEPPPVLPGAAVRLRGSPRPAAPLGRRAALLRREIETAMAQCDLVHDHGLWLPSNHLSATASRRSNKPRLVSPRGMLAEWSLGHHRWRKRLAWLLYQRRDLALAAAFHATSTDERDEVRNAGLRQPVAVIPNAVELPSATQAPAMRAKAGQRRALFMSRLHRKKGVHELLEAWARVRPPQWELVVAGPGEDHEREALIRRAGELGLTAVVSFPGIVGDDEKWREYQAADLFVLPTHSENFGLVVAEALASSVPVITTRGAPWAELQSEGCGWWIDIGTEPLVAALAEATRLDPATLRAMGRRGRELVERRYSWSTVAEQMVELYEWMLGRRASVPACVEI